jgi:hypothetical protein
MYCSFDVVVAAVVVAAASSRRETYSRKPVLTYFYFCSSQRDLYLSLSPTVVAYPSNREKDQKRIRSIGYMCGVVVVWATSAT